MRRTKVPVKILMFILATIMIVGAVLPTVGVAAARNESQDKTEEKTYEIVVAYDNSYSMYYNTDIWCQAKYAMEIFASMLDYDNGDKLTIFPMHPVKVDGTKTGQAAGNVKSITIADPKDLDLISKLYTPTAGGTPFTCVENAYSYLINKSTADEKWLIALTDGVYREGSGGGKEPRIEKLEIQNRLREMSFSGINVQYLAIFDPATTEKITIGNTTRVLTKDDVTINFAGEKDLYADVVTSADELKAKLIEICNTIFKRDELPANRLKGRTLELDLSMKNLIVFVQGKNAKIMGLEDSEGNKMSVLMNSNQRKYSTISCGDPGVGDQYEDSLFGQVVTFGECAKGTYTLNVTDAETIKIFYEPDVLLNVTLLDPEGNAVEADDDTFEEGDYTLSAEIVDRITGEDVSRAPLMGGNVNIDLSVGYNGEDPFKVENGGKFNLKVGDGVEALVTATYLEKYKLTNEDDPSIFPNPFRVIPKSKRFEIAASTDQVSNRYSKIANKSWEPIRVDLTLGGQPLTDEQLESVKFDIGYKEDEENPNPPEYQLKLLKGESAAEIHVAKDKNGKYVSPEKGDYEMKISASMEDEYGRTLKDNDAVDFKIRFMFLWLIILLTVIAAALIIFLIGFPVKPKEVYIQYDDNGKIRRKGPFSLSDGVRFMSVKKGSVTAIGGEVSRDFVWMKNSWIKNVFRNTALCDLFKCTDMTFTMYNVTTTGKISDASIAGRDFDPDDESSKKKSVTVRNNTSIQWTEEFGADGNTFDLDGKIIINRLN